MKRIALICLILLFSCENKTEKPVDLIPPDQMKNVLVDLFIAREIIQLAKEADTSKTTLRAEDAVFKKHRVTEKQFQRSHNYYASEIETYLKILAKAQNDLNRLSDQAKPQKRK